MSEGMVSCSLLVTLHVFINSFFHRVSRRQTTKKSSVTYDHFDDVILFGLFPARNDKGCANTCHKRNCDIGVKT